MIIASRFPLGFLDLVGAQNFGENPRQLAEFVQPVVDIGEQYLATQQLLVTGSLGAAAAGFNAFTQNLAVPVGEVWRVLAFNVSVAAGAGVTGTFAPAVRQAANRIMLADSRDFAAARTEWKVSTALPIWLPAGYELGIEIQNLAGGNPPASGTVVYTRLRA